MKASPTIDARRAPDWSQISERGSTLALRVFLACYRLFGRPLSLALVHAIVFYYFVTLPRVRRASLAYLRRIAARPSGASALGRRPGTFASFLHFREFALAIFDRIEFWFGREDAFRFQVSGREHYERLITPTRGGIIVGSHLGNFDALRALSGTDGRVVNVVMFTRHAPRINKLFQRLSPHAQVRVIQADTQSLNTVLEIRACIERGELVAMLGDRMESGSRGRPCRVPFLGDPVDLPTTPYWLAGLLGCPVFFMVALREGRGRYRVSAEVLAEEVRLGRGRRDEDIRKLVNAYARRLEHHCERAPYQWFNFFDYWHDEA